MKYSSVECLTAFTDVSMTEWHLMPYSHTKVCKFLRSLNSQISQSDHSVNN